MHSALTRQTASIAALLLVAACGRGQGSGGTGLPVDHTDAGDANALEVGPSADSGGAKDAAAAESDSAEPDAAASLDAVATNDAGAADAGQVDAQSTGADAAGACSMQAMADPGAPDRDRVVLLGHGFGAVAGTKISDVRTMLLSTQGQLADVGVRLDVGVRPARLAFVPSGAYALVLGEKGGVVALRVKGPESLTKLGQVQLPSADYGDLVMDEGGSVAWVVGRNSTPDAGLSRVNVGCDGGLTHDAGAFFSLRLAESFALLPGGKQGLILGGQAVFEPKDPNDTRLLQRSGAGWKQVAAFDLWADFLEAEKIAIAPDGKSALMPNGAIYSDEGGQVMVLSIDGAKVTESARHKNLPGAQSVLIDPAGHTALVTLVDADAIAVMQPEGGSWKVTGKVSKVGLATHLAGVWRGEMKGMVLAPAVGAQPQVQLLRIEGPGAVTVLATVSLGSGSVNIPGPVAVME